MPEPNQPSRDTRADEPRILYGDQEIVAFRGQRLLDVILDAGIEHRHICGGRGFCTSCRVELVDNEVGLSTVTALERERLGCDAGRLRLACQTRVLGDASVRVPAPRPSRFSPDGDDPTDSP
jgi:ferredoxin